MDAGDAYGHWQATAGTNDLPVSVFTEKLMTTTTFQSGGIVRSSGRITAQLTGKYLISLQGSIQTSVSAGIRQMCLGINGATDTQIYQVLPAAASYAWYTNGSGIVALNAGDTISMFLYHNVAFTTLSSGVAHIYAQYIEA